MALVTVAAALTQSSAQALPYDPYPWCAVYGGSWSGTSNCGFKTLHQCIATVSGIGESCEPKPILQSGPFGQARQGAVGAPLGDYSGA